MKQRSVEVKMGGDGKGESWRHGVGVWGMKEQR